MIHTIMKAKIIQIVGRSDIADDEKARQIVALAGFAAQTPYSGSDERAAALVGMQRTLQTIGCITPQEMTISPKLCQLLAEALADRTRNFLTVEARELFSVRADPFE